MKKNKPKARLGLVAATLLTLMGCDQDALPNTGSWRLVNYWAIWCTPCREEIPELNALNHYEDITVLGVNYDGKLGDELGEHATALGIRFDLLHEDPSENLGTPRPQVLPTTLVISPDGAVLATLVGPQTTQAMLTKLSALGRPHT